jgi:hypothetical protein
MLFCTYVGVNIHVNAKKITKVLEECQYEPTEKLPHLLRAVLVARLIFDSEDGGDMLLRTSVHTRTTRRYIPQDRSTHNYRRESLRSYRLDNILSCEELYGPPLSLFRYNETFCRNEIILTIYTHLAHVIATQTERHF